MRTRVGITLYIHCLSVQGFDFSYAIRERVSARELRVATQGLETPDLK
jgi:hypothetical protein